MTFRSGGQSGWRGGAGPDGGAFAAAWGGRCCLVKLEEEETQKIYFTDVGCRLLDTGTCRCRDYRHRTERVDDCVRLTPQTIAEIRWLPPTCAYRLVGEGKDLYWWHPL